MLAVLILVNALLLTAPWRERFYETDNLAPFSVLDGGEVRADFGELGEVAFGFGS